MLTRAAEIAGVDQWSFKDTLRTKGVDIVVDVPAPEVIDDLIHVFEAKHGRRSP